MVLEARIVSFMERSGDNINIENGGPGPKQKIVQLSHNYMMFSYFTVMSLPACL
ncbi:hypothetical protein MNBD_ALPHA04-1754, partial [hydrothermal vent metagenome]